MRYFDSDNNEFELIDVIEATKFDDNLAEDIYVVCKESGKLIEIFLNLNQLYQTRFEDNSIAMDIVPGYWNDWEIPYVHSPHDYIIDPNTILYKLPSNYVSFSYTEYDLVYDFKLNGVISKDYMIDMYIEYIDLPSLIRDIKIVELLD